MSHLTFAMYCNDIKVYNSGIQIPLEFMKKNMTFKYKEN
jgi:hypothetical protein